MHNVCHLLGLFFYFDLAVSLVPSWLCSTLWNFRSSLHRVNDCFSQAHLRVEFSERRTTLFYLMNSVGGNWVEELQLLY